MRLLLDEQYSPDIAEALRRRGHDVDAVAARPDLVAIDDEPLLLEATREGRALVINNVRDFAPITRRFAAEARFHSGLIFTSDRSLPRTRGGIGGLVESLSAVLDDRPGERALADQSLWLKP